MLFSSAAGVPTRYNSRSPAESDHLSIAVQGILDATTHALLRRATADVCVVAGAMGATTHALLRRATLPSGIYCLLFSGYNSRSPAESAKSLRSTFILRKATTHALLRRATSGGGLRRRQGPATTHALLRRATVILTEFVIDAT